ncbi:copper homeostasis protein CutC [Virgibacillus sp. C22-A2]|uniref:PF03932 family protein CutC n=1 Tax=Virgibacillus tibetensis TaxID=3042313 RepID=A0ABU6KCT1_9BACI|nr:copper homeostasis protein CutC [Virgibacillus sp. C22-A2]
MLVEVIVQNGEEAVQAEKLGADRLELVSAMSEGGLTPSHGTIQQVLNSVSIPVQVMIRPHSHYYNYTVDDMAIIRYDIEHVRKLGGQGIVFGALDHENKINEKLLKEVIAVSSDLDITFHRAFDEAPSQIEAYKTLLNYRETIKRILTSGGQSNCEQGKGKLKELVTLAEETKGPEILPGSGLTPDNIETIHQTVAANQYHFGKAMRKKHSFAEKFDEQAFLKVKNTDK